MTGGQDRGRLKLSRVVIALSGAGLALAALMVGLDLRTDHYFRLGPARPNVVVFLVDTLRADHLRCYGHFAETSPFLDRLATEGVLFERCRSQSPWTKPSVASLFSSLYSSAHQVVSYPRQRGEALDPHLTREDILPKQVVTLAEAFGADGYHTVAFVTNRWIDPLFGFHQGFDDFFSLHLEAPPSPKAAGPALLLNPGADYVNQRVRTYLDSRRPAGWERWLDRIGIHRRPLFIYVHYMDVHGPYKSPPPYDTMFDPVYAGRPDVELARSDWASCEYLLLDSLSLNHYRSRYDGQVRYLDHELESLVNWVRAERLLAPAIVAVTADHGEAFHEHGSFEHGNFLFEEEIHVPLIIAGPGFPAGRRSAAAVELIDLGPTLLSAVGAGVPEEFEGRDLRPLLAGAGDPEPRPSWSENSVHGHHLAARIEGEKKWIYDLDQAALTGVYDLRADPAEAVNLLGAVKPEEVNKRTAAMQAWMKAERSRLPITDSAPAAVLPDDVRRQLEALGYLGGPKR
jgi:arylsulfatase A-like enzyme